MYIRIIQGCLIFAVMIMFIFIAIVDQDYVKFGFYASLSMIVIVGLYLMRGCEEFIEHMNEQYRKK
jgi:bacteriorhodopsin